MSPMALPQITMATLLCRRFRPIKLIQKIIKLEYFKSKEAAITKQEVPPEGNQSLDLKEIAGVEPVAADNEDKNGQQGEAVIEKDDKSAPALPPADDEQQQKSGTHNQQEVEAGKANQQQEVNGSQPHNTPTAVGTPPVVETHQQFNGGNKRNNNQHLPGPDQRGVFIQGYDYQVAKVCSIHAFIA